MPKKKPPAEPDPNRLVRVSAGVYRSEDDRFEVRDGGTGWFITDSQQHNEFGQELVTGPFATLAAVREALPEFRRTTLKPLPIPEVEPEPSPKSRARSGTRSKGTAETKAGAKRKGGPNAKAWRTTDAKPVAKPKPEPKPKPKPEPKPKPPEHRLVRLLRDAARDRFPPFDLEVEILPSPPGRSDAVVSFSGHNVVASGADAGEVRRHLPADDPGGAMSAPFLTWLGLQLGRPPGSLDVVLVADGTGRPDRRLRLEPIDEPADAFAGRVARARRYREEIRLLADAERRGIVILGLGLAGRLEVSIELDPRHRGRGLGTALARAALGLVDEGQPLYAQVAPGNVASLRAFLRAGYRPIGAEVLFLRS